jgi:hypothetical protein
MNKIDGLLANYEPGLPKMKPDVLAQIKVIEAERDAMVKKIQQEQSANGPIILQRPGQEPVQLSSQDAVNIMQQQQKHIVELTEKIKELEKTVVKLQLQLITNVKKEGSSTVIEKPFEHDVKTSPVVTVEGD